MEPQDRQPVHEQKEHEAPDLGARADQLSRELRNFEEIARYLVPLAGEVPRLRGVDVWGGTLPLNGTIGGDHIIYVDFKRRFDLDARMAQTLELGRTDIAENLERCRHKAGLVLIDVAGHRVTDGLLAAMLHQALLTGALYELDISGQVTRRLFENLNTRFYQSSGANKLISMIYGEISEDARFRFLSAAHPFPVVFSQRHDRFMEIDPQACLSFPPLGLVPSLDAIDRHTTGTSSLGFKERYEINEWQLMGAGDILLMHSDGLSDHRGPAGAYFPDRLEQRMRGVKHLGARAIYEAVRDDLLAFGPPSDDISLVVIKLA